METSNTWPIKMTNRKRVVTPRRSVIAPTEKNREAVEKLQARAVMLAQTKLDIINRTIDLMEDEGLSYQDAKQKANAEISH